VCAEHKGPKKPSDGLEEWASEVTPESEAIFELERKLHKLRGDNSALRKSLAVALRDLKLSDERLTLALGSQKPVEKRKLVLPRKRGPKNPATACWVASDWHVEEFVDPKTINGRNEYNPEIAEESAEKFFKNSLRLLDIQRAGAEIQTGILALLGDFITGHIHEEFQQLNFMSPTEAILFVKRLLIEGLDLFLAKSDLEKIVLPCCYGNHGRTTLRPRISTAASNSFEWLMYKSLEQHYENEPRLDFMVATGAHLYIDVGEYTIRFTHGDSVRYAGGVGGISIPLRKAVDRWDSFHDADLTVCGHWHTRQDYQFALMNGSSIGYNAFALSIKAEFQPPSQSFFLVDHERASKTVVAPIWVR
jgi:hypothetical protein